MSLPSRILSRSINLRILPSLACTSRQQRQYSRQEDGRRYGRYNWRRCAAAGSPLLALSWMVTLKDFFGVERVELDKDPIKDKIKQSWLQRKYGAYDKAVEVLHEALSEANERKEPMAVTRVIDELANTYYQKGDWAEAERCFRDTIQRMVTLHGTKDSDPVFIGISLKLADLLAKRGDIDNAETGLTHCLRKQMKAVDSHLAKNSVARGAMVEDRHPIDTRGASHSDPLALFGMCLDAFAHFLITYRDESRLEEADEYMGEVLKISYQIYGSRTAHSVHMASNFGTICVIKNRFPLAVKYLSYAVDRAVHIDECAQMLPTLYCSYAEALFHAERKEEAIEWARRALSLSRSTDEKTRKYVSSFLADLEKETGRRKRFYFF
ncbi:hypothetical protein PFISCL1PPCAC_6273 [Pristionchus fissidentatus]|uniref:Uncharacterized protein n=1 Tax=Pristionchus fissidentatus TaxID=1538716 RepID=A0AAV5V8C3_9BILA|nr:hypothetical protein PFISCL1PPCAC_6273 [Pristionchus fissidentatus]